MGTRGPWLTQGKGSWQCVGGFFFHPLVIYFSPTHLFILQVCKRVSFSWGFSGAVGINQICFRGKRTPSFFMTQATEGKPSLHKQTGFLCHLERKGHSTGKLDRHGASSSLPVPFQVSEKLGHRHVSNNYLLSTAGSK